jgi:hypothetical protein
LIIDSISRASIGIQNLSIMAFRNGVSNRARITAGSF